MKSIAVFFCFVSLITSAAYAETTIFGKPYAVSGTFLGGFCYGTLYEIVYQDSQSSEYLSELQWELKPLIFMGLGFSLEPVQTSGFFTGLSVKAGLPMESGTMEDRDWDWERYNKPPGTLTNFSSHTNKLKASVLLTLDAGYSFSVTDWFYLRVFGSFDYFFFKMEGRDGYRSYIYEDWEIIPFSGPVIRYSQHWFVFSPGFSASFILNRFTLTGTLKITPFILCVDEDDHLLAATLYNDYMSGGFAIEPALEVSYAINPRLKAGLACSYRYITGARGYTVMDEYEKSSSSFVISNAAGADLNLFETSLYLKFVF